MEYSVVRVTPSHYKDLQFLFKHCFHRAVSDQYFNKKFDTKRFGADHIGYLAYTADGLPAAYYGLYPILIQSEGRKYLAAVSADTMTHELHRGKGLFDSLSRKTFVLAKECGISVLYCFPNQFTLPGSIKLGWQYIEDERMMTFSIKVKTFPLAKIARKINFLNVLYKKYAGFVLKKYRTDLDYFDNSLAKQRSSYVIHDSNYFSYKSYTDNRIININGTDLWIKIDGEFKIGDINIDKKTSEHDFFKKLKGIAFWIGCTEIQTTVCKESELFELLSKYSEPYPTFCVGRMDLGIDFEKESLKFVMADFDSF